MGSYLSVLGKYASSRGRASRQEYWIYHFVQLIIWVIAYAIDQKLEYTPEQYEIVYSIIGLFHFLPNVAVTIRRLHDTDKGGGWLLVSLTVIGVIPTFIFMVQEGTPGSNRFGRNPHDPYGPLGTPEFQGEAYITAQALAPIVPGDPITEIERLSKLRADGSLTEAEFQTMKARILNYPQI